MGPIDIGVFGDADPQVGGSLQALQELGRLFASSGEGSRISLSADFTFRWCHMNFRRLAAKKHLEKTVPENGLVCQICLAQSVRGVPRRCRLRSNIGSSLAQTSRTDANKLCNDMLYAKCPMLFKSAEHFPWS